MLFYRNFYDFRLLKFTSINQHQQTSLPNFFLLDRLFVVAAHCRACTKQCTEITKNAVQSTAFLLRIAEDSKGKALNYAMQAEIFASRSNQPRREIEPPLHLPRRSRFELPQALFHSRHSAYERLLRGGQGHASALGGARWQRLEVVGALFVRGV